jgi:hypothetical protein
VPHCRAFERYDEAVSSRLVGLVVLCGLLAACSEPSPPPIDPRLTAAIPPGATAIAGVDLTQLRASPYFARLKDLLGAAPSLESANFALACWNGSEYAIATRNGITGPLAAAATAQQRTGQPGEGALTAWAEPVVRGHAIWGVLAGGRNLPLSGNAANLNRLLRATEHTTVTLDLVSGMSIAIVGYCGSGTDATRLEQTLRALLTLSAASTKDAELSRMLHDIAIERTDTTVTASLRIPSDRATTVLDLLLPTTH